MDTKVEEILNQPYTRSVSPQDDGTYFAEIIEFPSCFAQGNSQQEALEILEQVAATWLEIALENNKTIPSPMDVGASGRFVVRLPKEMHRKVIIYARRNGISLNQFIVSAVSAAVGVHDYHFALADRMIHFMVHAQTKVEANASWKEPSILPGKLALTAGTEGPMSPQFVKQNA